jgi:hypothetical protein
MHTRITSNILAQVRASTLNCTQVVRLWHQACKRHYSRSATHAKIPTLSRSILRSLPPPLCLSEVVADCLSLPTSYTCLPLAVSPLPCLRSLLCSAQRPITVFIQHQMGGYRSIAEYGVQYRMTSPIVKLYYNGHNHYDCLI